MNARADFEQQQDEEQRQQEALQALMEVAAAGLKEQAELLAYEAGVGSIWKQQLQPKGSNDAQH